MLGGRAGLGLFRFGPAFLDIELVIFIAVNHGARRSNHIVEIGPRYPRSQSDHSASGVKPDACALGGAGLAALVAVNQDHQPLDTVDDGHARDAAG